METPFSVGLGAAAGTDARSFSDTGEGCSTARSGGRHHRADTAARLTRRKPDDGACLRLAGPWADIVRRVQVEIDRRQSPAGLRLLDAEDLRTFKVVVLDGAGAETANAWPDVVSRYEEHAWVRIDALRELAGAAANPEWEAGFSSMIDFARSRDWVDDELGAVRGHVEHRPPV